MSYSLAVQLVHSEAAFKACIAFMSEILVVADIDIDMIAISA